jgi:hypothetical protein
LLQAQRSSPRRLGQIILFWNASTVGHETVAQVQIGGYTRLRPKDDQARR